ncbi:MAG: hypothetical protein NZM04_05405, partial [Methylacidiphilales bacterium]|nr:hypothetical protein [Candidatus Methylacidiphilales bacterium]
WAEVPFHMPRRFLYLATHEELSEKLKEYSMHPMHGIIRDDFFMDVLCRIKEKGLFGAFIFTLIPHYILPEHDRPIPLSCTNFDLKAWCDFAIRMNDIFNINIDIEPLKGRVDEIIQNDWELIKDIREKYPDKKIDQYINYITSGYHEEPYPYLNNQWKAAIDSLHM